MIEIPETKQDYLERAASLLEDEPERLNEYRDVVNRIFAILDEDKVFGQDHPLEAELGNRVPNMVARLGTFADMLESFSGDPVFEADLLTRLNRPGQYPGARFELEIAQFISQQQTPVEFVDPDGEQRKPDLMVDGVLPIEIKQLRNPDHIVEQSGYYNEIQNAVHRAGAPTEFRRAGKIHRPLAEPEKEEFITCIEEAILQVGAGEVVEIRETSLGDPVFEMLLTPHEREEELEDWLANKDFQGPLTGPSQRPHSIHRMRREIGEKVDQLPEDQSGVVLFEADPYFHVREREAGLLSVARDLMKAVFDHQSLLALVVLIRSRSLDMGPLAVSRENVRIADFPSQGQFGYRTFLTIHNTYCEATDGAELVDEMFFENSIG